MTQDQENQTPVNPEPAPTPPAELNLPVEKVVHINIDDIKPNTILVVNVDIESPDQKVLVTPAIAKLLSPFAAKLKEKHVSIMIMGPMESIDLIPESVMNEAGWFKKEKSLIINPYQK